MPHGDGGGLNREARSEAADLLRFAATVAVVLFHVLLALQPDPQASAAMVGALTLRSLSPRKR